MDKTPTNTKAELETPAVPGKRFRLSLIANKVEM